MGFPDAVAKTLPNQSTAKKDFRSVPFFALPWVPSLPFLSLRLDEEEEKGICGAWRGLMALGNWSRSGYRVR